MPTIFGLLPTWLWWLAEIVWISKRIKSPFIVISRGLTNWLSFPAVVVAVVVHRDLISINEDPAYPTSWLGINHIGRGWESAWSRYIFHHQRERARYATLWGCVSTTCSDSSRSIRVDAKTGNTHPPPRYLSALYCSRGATQKALKVPHYSGPLVEPHIQIIRIECPSMIDCVYSWPRGHPKRRGDQSIVVE